MTMAFEPETRRIRTDAMAEGRCACGHVRFLVRAKPMIVHGCHCRDCQRLSGGAFAINALFEADRVNLISGSTEEVSVPTPSGKGQKIARCPECKTAVWSNYHMGGLQERIRFVRVGTFVDPDRFPPDVHIYTASKQPHVLLSDATPAFEAFYDLRDVWSADGLGRYTRLMPSKGL